MNATRKTRAAANKGPSSQVVALRDPAGASQTALASGAHFAKLARRLGEGHYQATLMTGQRVDVRPAPEVDGELADQCVADADVVLIGMVGDDVLVFGALRTKARKAEELVLEAPKKLVLRAGKAKLVLSADGKIKLSGSDVTIDAPREVRLASARVEIP